MLEFNDPVLVELSNHQLHILDYPSRIFEQFAGYTQTAAGIQFYAFVANPDVEEQWYEVGDPDDEEMLDDVCLDTILISTRPLAAPKKYQSEWWLSGVDIEGIWIPVECCHLFRPTVQRVAMAKCRESLRAVSTRQTAQA